MEAGIAWHVPGRSNAATRYAYKDIQVCEGAIIDCMEESIMVLENPNPDLTTPGMEEHGTVAGLFRDDAQAEKAIQELKEAGFSGNQIGVACFDAGREKVIAAEAASPSDFESTRVTRSERGLLQRIKDFFAGGPESEYSEPEDLHGSLIGLQIPETQARYFESGIASGGTLVTVRTNGHGAIEALPILERNGADTGAANVTTGRPAAAPVSGEQRIALMGELLRVHKERITRGEVRMRKEVVTENRNVEVPVSREEVVVERVPAENRASGSFESGPREIRIPVTEERVRTEKEPVVTEEVKVKKQPVQETESVSEKVRREQLRVEREGRVREEEVKGAAGREKK